MSPLRPIPRGLTFGSVCSGIEAASVAWHPLGWRAGFLSEIEAFPRAVLSHHYPHVPLHGDFTTIQAGDYDPIDVLVGGTPCQSFSVAGLRGGMADERGNLALEYLRLADRLRPTWLVWENVPGVLSSAGGRDFGSFLGGMGQLGYGFAYRVLDAQFFGLAQRRKRVFVVGYLGDWRRAAAVLFEPASLRGDSAPRREKGERPAPTVARGSPAGGRTYGLCADTVEGLVTGTLTSNGDSHSGFRDHHGLIARPLTANRAGGSGGQRYDWETETFVTHALRSRGFDASEDGTGCGTPLIATATLRGISDYGDGLPSLRAKGGDAGGGSKALAVAHPFTLATRGRDGGHDLEYRQDGTSNALLTPNGGRAGIGVGAIALPSVVRRLTPRECERLQGFPDDYTLVPYRGKPAADGPRYHGLGNSMAVPCMSWIGKRIAMQHAQARP